MRPHEINELNNFISGWYWDDVSMCDDLINYFNDPNTKKETGKVNQSDIHENIKKSTDTCLDNKHLYPYLDALQNVLNLYLIQYSFCNECARFTVTDNVNIQYYKPHEAFYKWHTERNSSQMPSCTRHLVFMTYLNDVTDGGETEFFYQQVKVKPEKGLTLIWPVEWTHTHRGIPSPTQEKYIVTGWYNFV